MGRSAGHLASEVPLHADLPHSAHDDGITAARLRALVGHEQLDDVELRHRRVQVQGPLVNGATGTMQTVRGSMTAE
jgi:hypothetical protein